MNRRNFLNSFRTIAAAIVAMFVSSKATASVFEEQLQLAKTPDWEQLQTQLAGCLMAAEGSNETLKVQRGDWAWSLALDRIHELRAASNLDDLQRDRYNTLGWMHAHMCAMLDRGKDPRRVSLPEIRLQAGGDLGWSQGVSGFVRFDAVKRHLRCPECSKVLYTYRISRKFTGAHLRCRDCGWELILDDKYPTRPEEVRYRFSSTSSLEVRELLVHIDDPGIPPGVKLP